MKRPFGGGFPLWALAVLFALFACSPAVSVGVRRTTVRERSTPSLTAVIARAGTLEAATRSATAVSAVPPTAPTPSPDAPTPFPTQRPWREESVIGRSVAGQPLLAVRLGRGARRVVVIGGLHGAEECQTAHLVARIGDHFAARRDLLPPEISLYLLPLANPDGCVDGSRGNANGVDLNRNWDTVDWVADAEGPFGPRAGSGGTRPFSEPETAALRDWLLDLGGNSAGEPLLVIAYHSAVPPNGLVLGGRQGEGLLYAQGAGYEYGAEWLGNYTVTGTLAGWARRAGLIPLDVELPDHGPAESTPPGHERSHLQANLDALLLLLWGGCRGAAPGCI